MTTHENPPGRGRTLLVLLLMFIGAAFVTGAAAYGVLEWMPCLRSGSSFEGGCGYGAVMAAAGMSFVLFPLLFAGSALLYFRRGRGGVAGPAVPMGGPPPASGLLARWRATFALTLVVNALPLLLMVGGHYLSSRWDTVFWWAGMLTLLVNAVTVYQVADHSQRRPMPIVMAVISFVAGWMGAVAVFIYLHVSMARARPEAGPAGGG